jgi:hypothetical protein
MRTFLGTSLAAALVGLLLTAAPAGALSQGIALSPASGPVGTAVQVSSTATCNQFGAQFGSGPPTHVEVELGPIVGFGTEALASSSGAVAGDGSYTVSLTVPAGVRNGRYIVFSICFDANETPTGFGFADYVVTSPPGQPDPVIRLAGTDRIRTAIAVSKDLVADGGASDVVLSRSDSYADALAGTPLAASLSAPLLLTTSNAVDPATMQEIDRVLQGSGTVHLLGGTTALSDQVQEELDLAGYDVVRIAGTDRFATAVKIANELDPDTVFLATGLDFHDGLVAGAAAISPEFERFGAVLLTSDGIMPAATQGYLARHPSVSRFAVGPAAAAADPAATALAGTTFADTSRVVAEHFFPAPISVAVAGSGGFADALAGGVHASLFGAPLLYSDPDALPPTVATYLAGVRASAVIGFAYGGTAAISESVRAAVSQAIS